MADEVKQRKIEHVKIALGQDISVAQSANWNDVQFVHQALPEVDLDEIDTSVNFLGHTLRLPIFISSLTGGHHDVISINRNLARAAERYGLALGVGSQRAAIVNPEVISSYCSGTTCSIYYATGRARCYYDWCERPCCPHELPARSNTT